MDEDCGEQNRQTTGEAMSATKIWLSRDADYINKRFHNLWLGEPTFYTEAGVFSPDGATSYLGHLSSKEVESVGLKILEPGIKCRVVLKRTGRLLDGRVHDGGKP